VVRGIHVPDRPHRRGNRRGAGPHS
jgi:hypothetical protein